MKTYDTPCHPNISAPSDAPLEWKASFSRNRTSANLRTSLTSCMMYSGSTPWLSALPDREPAAPNEFLLAARPAPQVPEPPVEGRSCGLGRRPMPTERLFPLPLLCRNMPAGAEAARSGTVRGRANRGSRAAPACGEPTPLQGREKRNGDSQEEKDSPPSDERPLLHQYGLRTAARTVGQATAMYSVPKIPTTHNHVTILHFVLYNDKHLTLGVHPVTVILGTRVRAVVQIYTMAVLVLTVSSRPTGWTNKW